jgi:hypothetical protein
MILVITHDNLPKPFADLATTVMLPALKLGLNGFELRNHPLGRRDSADGKGSATPEMPVYPIVQIDKTIFHSDFVLSPRHAVHTWRSSPL